MSVRVDRKKESPRKLSILIALLHEVQLGFIHSWITSATRWYSYDLRYFHTSALDNTKFKKKISEYKWKYNRTLFEIFIFLLRQEKRNSQIYFHKINFPIVLLRVGERNKLAFDIRNKYLMTHDRHKKR